MVDPVLSDFDKRRQLGQVMTPPTVARLMASLIGSVPESVRILDPGAGTGALTEALVERLMHQSQRPTRVHVAAWEIDESLELSLRATLDRCAEVCFAVGTVMSYEVHCDDFLAAVTYERLLANGSVSEGTFDIAILNPPYRKIRADSTARLAVRGLGLEVSNLYAGFVAASLASLRHGGELVAITPRSFCNGPYFLDFRRFLFRHASIDRVHLFGSRTEAFKGDGVLQENVIYRAVRAGPRPDQVVISSSIGPDSVASVVAISSSRFVDPMDGDLFIHIPDSSSRVEAGGGGNTLDELGLQVSTGRVVDFRSRSFLRQHAEPNSVPLIYPSAFTRGEVRWPPDRTNKPVAIMRAEQTEKLLVPTGHYVLVRRMSSKEERRRVVAAVIEPESVPASAYAFENHLNYFHSQGAGLHPTLARGLAAFLNSEPVDQAIRQFNGHTQVNAADLRRLRYPTRAELLKLGTDISSRERATEHAAMVPA